MKFWIFSYSGKNQVVFGLNLGEKSFFAGMYKEQAIIVVSDFISANAYKSQITSMGKTAEIISGGIESPYFCLQSRFIANAKNNNSNKQIL